MSSKINSIRAKLKSKLSTDAEDKKRLKAACSTVVSGLETTLSIVKDAAGNVGVPGLQAGIGGVLFMLSVIKKTSQNADDVEKLTQRIETLNTVLQNSRGRGTLCEAIICRIDQLAMKWIKVTDEVQNMASRHAMKRLIHYNDDVQAIGGHVRTISWSIESFTVETMLAIEFTLDGTRDVVIRTEGKLDKLGENMKSEFQRVNAKLDTKDGHPLHAIYARFDCKERTQCLEGTRVDILDQVYRWINLDDSRLQGGSTTGEQSSDTGVREADSENSRIFWINGSAGTGKTTIAYTIAEACRKRGILGASFFCSRDDAECSNPNLIFTTIAYQLGLFFPPFRAEVTQTLKSNPDIGYSSVSYQLEELIVKPLRAVGESFPSCVIVVDALDECKDVGSTSIILSSLSRHVFELSPLKILVTSRPEQHITKGFKSGELSPVTQRLILHEVALEVVQNDIAQYLHSNLAMIRDSYELQYIWPLEDDIRTLSQLSSGLFIFAATSIKFINDQNYCDPRGQLADLLCNTATLAQSSSSPHHHLDQLYTQVLTHAFPNISPSLAGRLKMVLGTIVLLQDPLSPLALEMFLKLRTGTVRGTLAYLHSVIIVPEGDVQVIRLLHPSFFDFITSSTRCRNFNFVIDMRTQHTLLARICLETMKVLTQDICGIQNPSILNSEIKDLSTRIMKHIPPHIQYACRHWAFHLANAMISDVLLDLLKEFALKYMLYWVEACSLLGELRNALLALDVAQRAIQNTSKKMTDVTNLLRDCECFTRAFFQVLAASSLQIYHSGLLFAPTQTLLRKTYSHELFLPIMIYNASETTWNSCIRTMDGHTSLVYSVAFSPDGARIVSGSSDHTLRLWDTVSGAHLNTLKGHSDRVNAVAFSPDGTRIVSGSGDTTLRLWDAMSGAHLNILTGHFDGVKWVAFSPNGTRIVSGSFDDTLQLWDAITGVHFKTLTGHSDAVISVAFSPDSICIVSGSHDGTIRLWDAVSGAHLHTFMGHSAGVTSVAFSKDGTRIISGSGDQTLRLWNAVTFVHLNTYMGHSGAVWSVAFSPDGTRIASGFNANTIHVWDAVSGAHLHTLMGHSQAVSSVAFSPDGTRIVSGSWDNTLRLWDAVTDVGPDTHRRHFQRVLSVTFSPDGTCIASVVDDYTIQLWDPMHGTCFRTLTGHFGNVNAVAFSPDSVQLVSGSYDRTLRLWNTVSGACISTLTGHSDTVNAVAFSPDSTCVVSGSYDGTLRLWDSASGAHLNTFEGHSDYILAVAFSLDSKRVMSASGDKSVRLWDAVNGAHLNTLIGHSTLVQTIAFSPDGRRVVSGSYDYTVRLWEPVSGALLHTLRGHSHAVMSVAFSQDGTHIISGSEDGILCLWDTASGTRLDTFTGGPASATSLGCCINSSPLSLQGTVMGSPNAGYIMQDGWICSFPQRRRLCWLPVSCRPRRMAFSGNVVALVTEDGRPVFIDFTGIDFDLHLLCSTQYTFGAF